MEKTTKAEKKIFVLRDRNGDLSKNWYVEWKEKGKQVKKYFDINHGKTVKERRKRGLKYLRELRQKEAAKPENLPARKLLYNALEFERPHLRKKSFQTYKSKLDQFFFWLGKEELTTDALRRYFTMYRKSHTQTGTYAARRQLMTFFKKAGIAHLLEPIKINKGEHQPLRYFQPHQCKRLLDYMYQENRMLWLHCLFIYYTAIRPRAELRNIRVDDIFFSERKIAIRGEFSKNHKTEFVRIAPNFFPIIEHLKDADPGTYVFPSVRSRYKPASRNYYGEKFKQVLKHLRFSDSYQLYSWKHTGAIAVYKITKNIMALKDHCRHVEIGTTQGYLRQLGIDDYDDFYDNFPAPTEWK